MYFLMVHIVFSSAVPTNSLHVLCFVRFIIRLNSFLFFFHSMQSMLLLVLQCINISQLIQFFSCVHEVVVPPPFTERRRFLPWGGFRYCFTDCLHHLSRQVVDGRCGCECIDFREQGRYSCSLTFSVFHSVFA